MAVTLRLLVLVLAIAAASAAVAPMPAPATAPASNAGLILPNTANVAPGTDLIEATCKLTKRHRKLCTEALSSEPLSHKANQHQLAAIALRLAARNATENAGYIIGLADQSGAEPKLQQSLTDCTEQYQDAIDQVRDAVAAVDDSGYQDAITWIQAAMSDVKLCQEECKEVVEHRNVLTKRNGDFNRLCSITISIIRSLM